MHYLAHVIQHGVLLILCLFMIMNIPPARAEPLTQKSVDLVSTLPSESTQHKINFTYSSIDPLGSVVFEYCTNSPFIGDLCTTPVGLSLSGATLSDQTGETGFSIGSSSSNKIILTRTSTLASAIPATYTLDNVVNQSTANTSVYIRISTYVSEDGSGTFIDEGAVVYSTTQALSVSGYVPPYLTFCVGVTVALNCTSFSGSWLTFGELSPRITRAVSSQFALATNDESGYSTTVTGPTMTSGNNIIPALSSPSTSQLGQSQFGINLRANSNPSIGSEPIGLGNGVINDPFSRPNQFYYSEGVLVSSSLPSDFNIFTVSYIVNVHGSQPPGVYTSTITYIASASF